MPEQTYPTPLHSQTYDTGPLYLKFLKRAKDYGEATIVATYEDKGFDVNYSAADVPQIYELIYDGLADEDANILDQFWDFHKRWISFTFIEPRDHPWTYQEGNTVTGCFFLEYEKDHADVNGVKLIQKRRVVIVKPPV